MVAGVYIGLRRFTYLVICTNLICVEQACVVVKLEQYGTFGCWQYNAHFGSYWFCSNSADTVFVLCHKYNVQSLHSARMYNRSCMAKLRLQSLASCSFCFFSWKDRCSQYFLGVLFSSPTLVVSKIIPVIYIAVNAFQRALFRDYVGTCSVEAHFL